jgi:hypothetical protein
MWRKVPDMDRVHAIEKGKMSSNDRDTDVAAHNGSGVVKILSMATMAMV